MKKKFKIEVDCANCALKMQDAANQVQGVKSVNIGFMTQKMTVDFEDGANQEAVMNEIVKACKKVEPDCEIYL